MVIIVGAYFSLGIATPWEDTALRLGGLSNAKGAVSGNCHVREKLQAFWTGTIEWLLTPFRACGGWLWGIKNIRFVVQKWDKQRKFMAVVKARWAFWSKQKWCNEMNVTDEWKGRDGAGENKRKNYKVPSTLSIWSQLISCCLTWRTKLHDLFPTGQWKQAMQEVDEVHKS